jgi:hypothetical protein
MKNTMTKLLALTTISLMLTGCFEAPQPVSDGGGTVDTQGGGSSNGDNGGGGTTNGTSGTNGSNGSNGTPGTGTTCHGTEADGQGSGMPIHHWDMMLAGHQPWVPGTYASPLAQSTMPTVEEASYLFKSDNRLRVRFKILSQPFPTAGEEYCYGRAVGQASDPYNYTKLRFRVKLRDVVCNSVDPQDPTKCNSYGLGSPYRYQYIEPTSVGSCSNIIEIGNLRNSTQWGTVIEVDDVKSDSTCQYNNTYCPAEKIVRAASCWHMKLQIVTDDTQDFQ